MDEPAHKSVCVTWPVTTWAGHPTLATLDSRAPAVSHVKTPAGPLCIFGGHGLSAVLKHQARLRIKRPLRRDSDPSEKTSIRSNTM